MNVSNTVYRWKVVDTYGRSRGYILGRDRTEAEDKLQNLKERNKWAKGLEGLRIVIDAENMDDVLTDIKTNLMVKNIHLHKLDMTITPQRILYQNRLTYEKEFDTYTKAVNAIRRSEKGYHLQMEGGRLHR